MGETVYWIIAVWLFATGGAIGSFLNVVVYRLPAGKSLTYPGSHCPRCNHPIRWHDNVPIFGWILLTGRCRDCGGRISARYPVVEAITAGLFLLVGLVEGLGFGGNLPVRSEMIGNDGLPDVAATSLVTIYHLLLLSTLWAAVLIEYDGHRPPWRFWLPAVVVGWLAPVVWPFLHPVPACAGLGGPIAGLVDGTTGLAAGLGFGLAGWLLVGPKGSLSVLAGSGCVGLYLGWQAVIVPVLVTLAMHLAFSLLGRLWPRLRSVPPVAWLAVATLVWILVWQPLADQWPLLG